MKNVVLKINLLMFVMVALTKLTAEKRNTIIIIKKLKKNMNIYLRIQELE